MACPHPGIRGLFFESNQDKENILYWKPSIFRLFNNTVPHGYTYMRKSNVRHLNQSIHSQEESEGEASSCEVRKMVQKRGVIGKLISGYDLEVCFIQETKMQDYSDSLVLRLWNAPSVSCKHGVWAIGLVALFGAHKASGFRCVAVGIYAPCCTRERRRLWRELCPLKHAFEDPWFLIWM
ncbi:hypothetical protein POTOM_050944 [Populus tomentosa]|uniref:Uncharacterized protein n=1 Tax=Populus tomentosa TaxID=118781 RepID=A0A8X8C8I0_POPTO|nr:hypothetical protein POTOM_050944 [Populus tomentosa]